MKRTLKCLHDFVQIVLSVFKTEHRGRKSRVGVGILHKFLSGLLIAAWGKYARTCSSRRRTLNCAHLHNHMPLSWAMLVNDFSSPARIFVCWILALFWSIEVITIKKETKEQLCVSNNVPSRARRLSCSWPATMSASSAGTHASYKFDRKTMESKMYWGCNSSCNHVLRVQLFQLTPNYSRYNAWIW